MEQRSIGYLLGRIFGRPETANHDVADHWFFPGRMDATRTMRVMIGMH